MAKPALLRPPPHLGDSMGAAMENCRVVAELLCNLFPAEVVSRLSCHRVATIFLLAHGWGLAMAREASRNNAGQ